jgi:hypothetical protein
MATKAAIHRYTLPRAAEITMQGGGGSAPLMFSPKAETIIVLSDQSEHALPSGAKAIYVQQRQCGDFYCLIDGRNAATSTGETLEAAFLNALALAA